MGQAVTADPMKLMGFSGDECRFETELFRLSAILLRPRRGAWVDGINIIGIIDVNLVRAASDNSA